MALSEALRAYGLEGATCTPMPGTTRNDAWGVWPSNGDPLVLRRCRRNQDPARIELQISLQQRLVEHRVPTPRVRRAHDGREVVDVDGVPWFMTDRVAGAHYEYGRSAAAAAAGAVLGAIHLAWADGNEADVEAPANWSGRRWSVEGAAAVDRLERRFARDAPDEVRSLRALVEDDAVGERQSAVVDLPSGWIHGDYHGRNLLFRGDRVAAVLDFDVCHRDALVYDVARALHSFGRTAARSSELLEAAATAFLAGYETTRSLTTAERAALPDAAVVACLRDLPYYDMVERDGGDATASFRHHVAAAASRRSHQEVFVAIAEQSAAIDRG